ncbi:alpha-D-ribose 1-methylphosphonate 5-triphosphate synthase subunit PhnH [Modicisalibacter xianhensis]|uniref:Alpha-D-ribose 1-methylphosphonate 5-triphosphate synthase subunit PhnH n=1 Tax=Modicisalibacter xianhensis TaxID=442341 RepID=A0A4R8FFN5_9GAMM|nr:phosphonate C-P lyase system protein PhnH [Halomonas xianhensis]TDX24774.1 alpha-D-ribose 1-methylphosphonate 5-triphosphate synthase subunit PhnH [Halomonas xianhensis]
MNMLWPGLTDPVHDSQRLFRQLLQAMSEPGTLHTLDVAAPPEDAPIGAALWGAMLTLCDLDTNVWIARDLDTPALRSALTFHTGCRLTDDPASADFAVVTPASLHAEVAFATGSDEYPDRSTTLLVVLDRLADHGPWQLSGPGIPERRRLDVGADEALMQCLARNRSRFPRGLDALLACDARLTAIPRSTRIEKRLEESRSCMSQ